MKFTILVVSLVFSFLASAFYTLYLNPEIQFWKTAFLAKKAYAEKIRQQFPNCLVLIGGSSSAFQIDVALLNKEFGIPSINGGMHAGMGTSIICAVSGSFWQPGDDILLCIEPTLLGRQATATPLGLQMLAALYLEGARFDNSLSRSALKDVSMSQIATAVRPGLDHFVRLGGKALLNEPLYRYQASGILPNGSIFYEGAWQNPQPDTPKDLELSKVNQQLLDSVVRPVLANGGRAYWWLPRTLYSEGDRESAADKYKKFLKVLPPQIAPVSDPLESVSTDPTEFSDTHLHVKRERAEAISQTLAKHILESRSSPAQDTNPSLETQKEAGQ